VEQVPEPAVGEADPAVFVVEPEQDLSDRDGEQFGVSQSGSASASFARGNDMIVELHIECGQEGVQVVRHSRSWTPSFCAPWHRHATFKESII
jgi:hypothetical protein